MTTMPKLTLKKMHVFCYLVCITILFLNSCAITTKYSDADIKRIASQGNTVVYAINKYYKTNGTYPNSIQELVPNYLEAMPNTGFETKHIDCIYNYQKIEKQKSKIDSNTVTYQITVNVDKFSFVMPKELKMLVYRPSKDYSSTKKQKFIRNEGDWAVMVFYR